MTAGVVAWRELDGLQALLHHSHVLSVERSVKVPAGA